MNSADGTTRGEQGVLNDAAPFQTIVQIPKLLLVVREEAMQDVEMDGRKWWPM